MMACSTPNNCKAAAKLECPWFVGGLYLLLALVMTFPLCLRFTTHVPFGAVDLWQNYWNFWWWKTSLFDLHTTPYATKFLFHPSGSELVFHTHSPFNMIVSMPVNLLLGPAAAYNFCVLISIWLSGFTMYLLARELTGDARGAFLAGLIFTFFPQHLDQTLEHLNLFSTEFIPLALYYFFRLAHTGGWRNAFGLGFAYALNGLVDWHLGLMLSLTLLFFIAAESVTIFREGGTNARFRPYLLNLILAGAIAAVILLPAVIPLLRGMFSGETYFQKPAEEKGIDPYYLLLPSFHHPIWGRLTFDAYSRRAYDASGFVCFLGFTPLALAACAIIRRAKGSLLWFGYMVVATILALGSHLFWNATLHENIPLPFALFEKIPLLSFLRVANRFMIPASVGLSVLVALGWKVLVNGPSHDAQTISNMNDSNVAQPPPAVIPFPSACSPQLSASKKPLFYLSTLLILLEYLWLPYPMQKIEFSPYYSQLAKSTRPGAVLDIPFTSNGKTVGNMRAQTAHGHPIAGGYLSTLPPAPLDAIKNDPVLSDLAELDPAFINPLDTEHLLKLGFTTVILHKERTESAAAKARNSLDKRDPKYLFKRKTLSRYGGMSDEKFSRIRAEFERVCGNPFYEDEEIVVFNLDREVRR